MSEHNWDELRVDLQERIYHALVNGDSDLRSIILKFEEDYSLQDVSWYPDNPPEIDLLTTFGTFNTNDCTGCEELCKLLKTKEK